MEENKCKIEGEVLAAIAMALSDVKPVVHDVESMILTVKHNSAPWCVKAYSLRTIPTKK